MIRKIFPPVLICFLFLISCQSGNKLVPVSNKYEDLVKLFKEWRAFQKPKMTNGLPDYSDAAMKKQFEDLDIWKGKLNSLDTTGWPIKHQVDWYLVWAEMNGLDFEQRVTRPWANDPAFYVWFYPEPSDVPEREGPNPCGYIDLPAYSSDLTAKEADEISAKLAVMKTLYEEAKNNLTGNGKDLWVLSAKSFKQQTADLDSFAARTKVTYPKLSVAATAAAKTSEDFTTWLLEESKKKTGISGVGVENYNWYIQNVHLMPYDYGKYKQLLERELMRSHAALRLSEVRNKNLPVLEKITDPIVFDTVMQKGLREFMQLLTNDVMTVKPYMEPAMKAKISKFSPTDKIRGFFAEVDYRDPMPMRSHQFHWIDKAMQKIEPPESEIRREPTLYNIFDSRAEGLATAMEELLFGAGLYKNRPRAEELVWIMLAERAARGLGGLYQHGQEMNFDQATRFASKWVPWGLLPADGETIQWEEHFYLQQPGYETSYVSGKHQIDQLIAQYGRQHEGKFDMKIFMDEFLSKGIIPMSLIYWEMTGDRTMIDRVVAGH
jgi:hypothetical protein